jgi:hypothetical protein
MVVRALQCLGALAILRTRARRLVVTPIGFP